MINSATQEISQIPVHLGDAMIAAEDLLREAEDYFRLIEMASAALSSEYSSAFIRVVSNGQDKLVEALRLIERVRLGDVRKGEFHACN